MTAPARRPRRILLEVCVGSARDALIAADAGADRIELNSELALDGLTPLRADLEQAGRGLPIPFLAMIRPHARGFVYSDDEIDRMAADAATAQACGACGVVFGVLTGEDRIDLPRCRRFLRSFAAAEVVFHRAFDRISDQFEALDQLIDLGLTRVLTSGDAPKAIDGADRLARLVDRAAGRIGVLPGGGVTSANVDELIRRTICEEVHSSCRTSGELDAAAVRDLRFQLNFAERHLRQAKF